MKAMPAASISLKNTLQRGVLGIGISVLCLTIGITTWIASQTQLREQAAHFQSLNELIAELVRPSVAISEFGETQRLLGLVAERQGVIPAVITNEGDLLLSDYTQQSLFEPIGSLRSMELGCARLKSVTVRSSSGKTLQVVCTQLLSLKEIGQPGKHLGEVVALYEQQNPIIPAWIRALLIVTILLTVLLLFGFLRKLAAREIPRNLEYLAEWVEGILNDKNVGKIPPLRFHELNDLGKKIAEMIEHHERRRDQAVIGQLTSGLMHDIRTPLHPIVTAHGLVAEQGVETPKRLQRLENLFKTCTTNLPIIGNLIESTLDGNREIHIESRAADLRDTVEQAVELLSQRALSRNVAVELELGNTPMIIPHDPTQLSRVFSNVIKNSIDAITAVRNANSEEKTNSSRIRLEITHSKDGGACIQIEDTGPGLPPDPSRVFRIFRSSKPQGSGLGLMVSRKIVEAHGGTLVASYSKRLAGARFDVNLPGPSTTVNNNNLHTKQESQHDGQDI